MSGMFREDDPNQTTQATAYVGDNVVLTCHFKHAVSNVTATVDFGDGKKEPPFTFSGMEFSVTHIYKTPGVVFHKTSVTDQEGKTSSMTTIVVVLEPTTESIKEKMAKLFDAKAIAIIGSSVYDKLAQAQSYMDAKNCIQARNVLQALINQLIDKVDISCAPAAILIGQIQYMIESFSKASVSNGR